MKKFRTIEGDEITRFIEKRADELNMPEAFDQRRVKNIEVWEAYREDDGEDYVEIRMLDSRGEVIFLSRLGWL